MTECDVKVQWYLQVEAETPVSVIADSWNPDGAGLHLLPTKNHKSVWLWKKKGLEVGSIFPLLDAINIKLKLPKYITHLKSIDYPHSCIETSRTQKLKAFAKLNL